MEEEVNEAEKMGFTQIRVEELKVGDVIAYVPTMFGFGMGEIKVAMVTHITCPDPDNYPEGLLIEHNGGEDPAEIEEGEPVWVKR